MNISQETIDHYCKTIKNELSNFGHLFIVTNPECYAPNWLFIASIDTVDTNRVLKNQLIYDTLKTKEYIIHPSCIKIRENNDKLRHIAIKMTNIFSKSRFTTSSLTEQSEFKQPETSRVNLEADDCLCYNN